MTKYLRFALAIAGFMVNASVISAQQTNLPLISNSAQILVTKDKKEATMKVCILYGSTRPNRLGIRAVRFFEKQLMQGGHHVTIVDALEEKLPILEKRLIDYERESIPARLLAMQRSFHEADAFIIVAGEYNHTIQPGLSNLIDHFQATDFAHRPVLLVTYSVGAFGGIRSLEHVRAMTSTMGMVSIPATLAIAKIEEVFNEKNECLNPGFAERSTKSLAQLLWYAQALKNGKENLGTP